ncbi:putative membrane protein YphA (DoxX/SURF4 family) [Microbacterium natoriense]|uniref:Membrane protein YphA (DoxX/SURF4 family) n=1 Tax=Microbacterium natoriense TaxID=284570 RepID=A0AAW8F1A0_9MICO|nr:hypothetical protein [Microbacterium natoriense]MDQ0649558.1 putative membrane protein YphA (DoxX/SURF4 family) [Microbacterium natoriense]
MQRDAAERRRDHVVIAVTLYVFISLTAGLFTFMRGFEFTGCSGSCDLPVMGCARILFLLADIGLLALVLPTLLILGLLRRPVLWLAVSALIAISALAIASNVVFTVAQATGNS